MKLYTSFLASMCLNLALVCVLISLWVKHGAPKFWNPTTISQAATTQVPAAAPATNSALFAAVEYVTNRFDWSKIESDDWEKLAANLRAVGCPEQTVRDLIFARARRAKNQIERCRSRVPFWAAGLRREQDSKERERFHQMASERIVADLVRAVGSDSDPSDNPQMRDLEEQALMRFILGPMPEASVQQLAMTMKQFEERCDAVRERCQGVELDDDIAELDRLHRQFKKEVGELLTREQFEEFSARCAMMKLSDDIKWEATDLTPSEVCQIALIRARYEGPTSDLFHGSRSTTGEEDRQIREETFTFLGARRAAEFERAANSDFQRLFDLSKDQNLPREAAIHAYDIRQLAESEAEQLRKDASLSDVQHQERFEQMQAETQEAMLKTLGAAACQQYLHRGGEWVTNFSKL